VAAAATPMVLFLASAVNPNGLEVAAGFAFLSSLLLLVGPEPVPRRWPWLVAAGVAGVLLAQARGISPLWMLVVVIIVIVMTPWPRVRRELRRSGTIVAVAVVAVGVVLSVGWTLATGTLARMGEFPGATDTPRRAFFLMVTRAFDPGLIGYFGWLDAPAPAFAYALWSFLSFAIVVVAFAVGRARDRWAVGVAATALLILPAVVQAVSIRSSGYVWQGRYALVAYIFLIAIATVVVGEHTARRRTPIGVSRRATWTVATLVVVGHAWALLAALQRYQGGLALDQVVLNPIWVPPGGIVLWILVVAAGVAFTSFALVVASTRTAPAAGDDADLEDATNSPVR
jgi:hypothetical protein